MIIRIYYEHEYKPVFSIEREELVKLNRRNESVILRIRRRLKHASHLTHMYTLYSINSDV